MQHASHCPTLMAHSVRCSATAVQEAVLPDTETQQYSWQVGTLSWLGSISTGLLVHTGACSTFQTLHRLCAVGLAGVAELCKAHVRRTVVLEVHG